MVALYVPFISSAHDRLTNSADTGMIRIKSASMTAATGILPDKISRKINWAPPDNHTFRTYLYKYT